MSILDKNYLSLRVLPQRVDVLVATGDKTGFAQFEHRPEKGEWKLPLGLKQWEGMPFEKVVCSVDNEMFGLVPSAVFDPARIQDYLVLSVTTDPSRYVFLYDQLPVTEMVVVYAIEKSMYHSITTTFPSVVFRHYSSICSPHFLRVAPRTGSVAYVHICPGAFYLVLQAQGKMRICNRFVFRAPEDILYYVLFALEQTGCRAETTTLVLGGEVQQHTSALVLLKEFFTRVELDEINDVLTDEMKYQGAFAGQYLCV